MKKKIRDITTAEVRRICKVHVCPECPLYRRMNEEQVTCLLDDPESIPKWMLDEEIEVPDEDRIKFVIEASHISKEAWKDLFAYMKEHGFIYARNN